jgi:hypothetical protein
LSNRKIKPIENYDDLCFKCLKQKSNLKKYSLYRSDYGSRFDNNYTFLQICDECEPKDIEMWFDETPEIVDGYCAKYKYEKNIIEFINTLPIEGQELFWNRCAYGACADNMNSQDWIDMKLGILPDEVYEEYGMYSPREIKAYKERFSTCEHPVNVIYNDGSKGCWCPFGAHGEYGQKIDANISDECYNCKHYKKRETPIKEMDQNTYKKYERYINAKIHIEKYKDLFE